VTLRDMVSGEQTMVDAERTIDALQELLSA
jgi:hypothetical protein